MDEISDTELDSMLQEIDNELQNQQQEQPDQQQIQQNEQDQQQQEPNTSLNIHLTENKSTNMKITSLTDDNESISSIGEVTISSNSSILGYNYISDGIADSLITNCDAISGNDNVINEIITNTNSTFNLISNLPKTSPTTLPATTSSENNSIKNIKISDYQEQEEQKNEIISDNLQNADSLSQASTIEFNDLRLQNDNNNIDNDLIENQQEQQLNIDNDSDKNIIIKENNNKLQRPNSLDLPINQQYSITSTSLNKNDQSTKTNIKNINSTAGQTPPPVKCLEMLSTASEQLLLSASSPTTLSLLNQNQQQQQDLANNDEQLSSIDENNLNSDNNISNENALGIDEATSTTTPSSSSITISQLGKIPPFWIPDNETNFCMQCKRKFSLIRRRHHCRACGQVLCSVCCSKKSKLKFLGDNEVKICIHCYLILNKKINNNKNDQQQQQQQRISDDSMSDDDDDNDITSDNNNNTNNENRSPNPNNPMEYCSMISPYQQIEQQQFQQNDQQQNYVQENSISVMVPVGVLKRDGVSKNPRKDKNVIFSDGIRPGCDLADLDNNWDDVKFNGTNNNRKSLGRLPTPTGSISSSSNNTSNSSRNRNKPTTSSLAYDESESFIPKKLNGLPPIYCKTKNEYEYKEIENNIKLIERLKTEIIKFAINKNFFVYVKIVTLKCCINKTIINFTTYGMHHVGQDEIIILLELNIKQNFIPKDIFIHLNEIYYDADKGQPILELGFSMPKQQNFLNSREHGGFLYIRSTFQCLQEIYVPESPFLIGILIHRWEVPWAKIFPLRLMLRLGAQYRYYPSPHISICERNSVYAEIAQTIINFLADFRNYSYTLATIKGMYIHMEDRKTNVLIPKNRYDQIIKALNNSSDHILALGGNFSKKADGHLVCIQNMESNCSDTHTYSTQAINIQGQPRKVTGASFIVLNGALKTTSGLSGKCSIVEDGLMVQILPQKMQSIRTLLKNMKDIDIICGPIDADETQTEIVCLKWTDNDTEFNIGVESPIDGKKMNGIPSIRVHSGFTYYNKNHLIRWTEVFIIQSGEESASSHGKDPIDISKLSEQIARNTSLALSSFLDLLAANGYNKIGLRVTLNQENVCFEAGSKNTKLAPLYMNALDNELIPILHKQSNLLDIEAPIIAELIFHILDK